MIALPRSACLVLALLLAGAAADGADLGEGAAAGAVAQDTSPAPPEFADRLERASALLDRGDYEEAERQARTLLAEAEALAGADSLAAADAIEVILKSALWLSRISEPENRALADRGMAIRERLLGQRSSGYAASLQIEGNLRLDQGRYEEATSAFERALAIREEVLGPEHPEVAETLTSIAGVLEVSGRIEEAKERVARALAIAIKSSGPESLLASEALIIQGQVLKGAGDYAGARSALERALAILESRLGPEHRLVARALRRLGLLLVDMRDFAAARAALERAVAIREKTDPGTAALAMALNAYGKVLVESGDPQRGVPFLDRAAAIMERVRGPEHIEVAYVRNALAAAAFRAGDFERARQEYARSLEIFCKAFGPDHANCIILSANLGSMLVALGDYAGARPLYEKVYEAGPAVVGRGTPYHAGFIQNLADLETFTGHLDRAGSLYEEAQTILLDLFGPDHPSTARGLIAQARLDLLSDRPSVALERSLRAERIARQGFRAIARSLTETEALRYEAIRQSGIDVALSTLQVTPARAGRSAAARQVWDEVIRSRAMILDETSARHRVVVRSSDKAIAALVRTLNDARDRLARLVTVEPDPDGAARHRTQLRNAFDDQQTAERRLAEASAAYREVWQRQEAGLRDVARALPASTALVGYIRYNRPGSLGSRVAMTVSAEGDMQPRGDPFYGALILGADGKDVAFVPLGPADGVDEAVQAWRHEAGQRQSPLALQADPSERRYREAGARLRAVVWDPLADKLRGARQVFLVPDGALSLVSFGTLPVGEERYLAETGPTLHYLSAERDAVGEADQRRPGTGLLAMGGPDFDAAPTAPTSTPAGREERMAGRGIDGDRPASCPDLRSIRFDPLPGARVEVQELAALWRGKGRGGLEAARGEVEALTGAASTEASLKARVRGRSVVHLATHGVVGGGECGSELSRLLVDDPLLHSGLALAGANRRNEARSDQEDGILTGEEIASLDFSETDWVVLSACETGLGKVQSGEGVLGLRRVFETAGARTLVMSLWAVDDAATREWMRALYEERLGGHSTIASVRQATLAVLEARRGAGLSTHPFFWGGFVAFGGWR